MRIDQSIVAGTAAQLFSITVWQSGLIVQKVLVENISAGSIMVVQFGIAALLMWIHLLCSRQIATISHISFRAIAWGMMAPGLVFWFGILGAARTDGVSIALIWGLQPLMGPVLARLLLGEKLHWTVCFGGLVGATGLAFLTLNRSAAGISDVGGNLMVLVAVVLSTLSLIVGRFLNFGSNRAASIATFQVTGAFVVACIFTFATRWTPPDLSDTAAVGAFAYLILFMTVLNFFAFNFSLARIPASWLALNGAFAPVIGLFCAWALLGANIRGFDLRCAGLILCGVVFPHFWRLLFLRERDNSPT